MLAIDIESGLTEAWERIATFVPKLLGFLAILSSATSSPSWLPRSWTGSSSGSASTDGSSEEH